MGLKLSILKELGFKNLYGVEINKKAYDIAKNQILELHFLTQVLKVFQIQKNLILYVLVEFLYMFTGTFEFNYSKDNFSIKKIYFWS